MATQSDRIKLRKIKAYAILILSAIVIIGIVVLLCSSLFSGKKPQPYTSADPDVNPSATLTAGNTSSAEPTVEVTQQPTQPNITGSATVDPGTTATVRPTTTTTSPVPGGLNVGDYCMLKGDGVNFRKEANTQCESHGKLKKGTILLIIEVNCGDGTWTKVKNGDTIGYVSTQFIQTAQRKVNVNETLKVRSGPGTSYDQVDTLNKGDMVTIIANTTDANWVKIQYANGKEGYVAVQYLVLP